MDRRTFVKTSVVVGAAAAAGALGVVGLQAWQRNAPAEGRDHPGPIVWGTDAAAMRVADLDAASNRFLPGKWQQRSAIVVVVPVAALAAASRLANRNVGQYAVAHP